MREPTPSRHYVLAADAAYFEGLVVTIASLLVNGRSAEERHLHVLDGGLTSSHHQYLRNMVQELGSAATVRIVPFDPTAFARLPTIRGQSLAVYSRLSAPDLIEVEEFLYLDSDLLVLNDLSKCPLLPLPDRICSGVLDPTYRVLGDDRCGLRLNPELASRPYLNSGVLGINRANWLEAEVTKRCVEFLAEHKRARAWDQSAINHVTHSANRVVSDFQWNRNVTRFSNQSVRRNDLDQIFHFIGGKKPWSRLPPRPESAAAHAVYRTFSRHLFRDCPIPPVCADSLRSFHQRARRKAFVYKHIAMRAKHAQWNEAQLTPAEVDILVEKTRTFAEKLFPGQILPWPTC